MDKAVLIVDDEALICMSLKQSLRSELGSSFRYESALCAEEALAIIEELAADGIRIVLLICDWLMPGIKGDELTRIVRARYPEVRTILISGQTDEEKIADLRTEGLLDSFFRKPWNHQLLIAECTRLLSIA